MEKIKTIAGLRASIVELEARQEEQIMDLRYQADLTLESLKPVNLIKSALTNSSGPSHRTGNILSNSIGLGAGYIAKRVIQGTMNRPISRFVGTAIMFGVQTLIAKNPDTLRTIGTGIFNLIRRRRRNKQAELDVDNYSENDTTRQ